MSFWLAWDLAWLLLTLGIMLVVVGVFGRRVAGVHRPDASRDAS